VSYVPAGIPASAPIATVAVSAAANHFTVSLPQRRLTVLSYHHTVIQHTITQHTITYENITEEILNKHSLLVSSYLPCAYYGYGAFT
jgi:hypothetical protein